MSDSEQPSPSKAIIHPWIDTLAIGGISIGFLVFLLVAEPSWSGPEVGERFIYLAALLNWPHFMATYRLLYGSKETVDRYPWSTKWMPLLLGLYCLISIFVSPYSVVPLRIVQFVAGGYLAWHYTGQTWGMMATFSYLEGMTFEDEERKWVRTSLRFLLAWHVVWFLFNTDFFGMSSWLFKNFEYGYFGASLICVTGATLTGAYGLIRYSRRHGRIPPMRVLVPWFSIWLWYAVLAIDPYAIFWVQLSHALQYMLFPARVEANRTRERTKAPFSLRHVLVYAVIVIGSGLLLFIGVPHLFQWIIPILSTEEHLANTRLAVGAFINIHHFFADGAIWKISNPAVRKELFSHLD